MKFDALVLFVICSAYICQPPVTALTAVASRRVLEKHGPLYESVKLLIADQSYYAAELWHHTERYINEQAYLVEQAIDVIDEYQNALLSQLEQISNYPQSPELRKCFKQYERDVARIDRELLSKYTSCKSSLDAIMVLFEHEIADEANFISAASQQIRQVASECDISNLQLKQSNQAGIVLCVVAKIGATNQRLAASLDLSLDLMLGLSLAGTATDDGAVEDPDSCRSYKLLKAQFDEVYNKINNCGNSTN